eukprot:1612608-Pleurochrysis_carterae.AAC.1
MWLRSSSRYALPRRLRRQWRALASASTTQSIWPKSWVAAWAIDRMRSPVQRSTWRRRYRRSQ